MEHERESEDGQLRISIVDEPRATKGFRLRRRNRRGRGQRGSLIPAHHPGGLTRSEQFADLVADSADRLSALWPEELSSVEFTIRDIPEDLGEDASTEGGPRLHLSAALFVPASSRGPATIVIHRQLLLRRCPDAEYLPEFLHDRMVEQVASLLNRRPESVDPAYGGSEF